MSNRTGKDRVLRQCVGNRVAHWLIALATFALVFSGFGQMPMYARYGIANIPGLGWSAEYGINLTVHSIGAFVLIAGIAFHLAYSIRRRRFGLVPRRGDVKESARIIAALIGRGTEIASCKYLAEQRLAYAFIGGNLLAITATGMLKVLKNVPGVLLPHQLVQSSTMIHNVAAVLLVIGLLAHFGSFAFKKNRHLLPAVFSGYVDAGYARERHSLWYKTVAPPALELLPEPVERRRFPRQDGREGKSAG